MIVKNIFNNPSEVPQHISNEFDYGLIENKDYLVMAMIFFSNSLWYMVDEEDKPGLYPNEIFNVVNNKLNPNWFFKKIEESEIKFIWGYSEICIQDDHYDNLLLRNEDDLKIYFKRKNEMLKAYEEGYFYAELKNIEAYNL